MDNFIQNYSLCVPDKFMRNDSLWLPNIFVRKSYLTCGYFYPVFVIVVRMASSGSCVN